MKKFQAWLNEAHDNFGLDYKNALADKSDAPYELKSGPGSNLFDLLGEAIAIASSTGKTVAFHTNQGKVTINKEGAEHIYRKILDILEPFTTQIAF